MSVTEGGSEANPFISVHFKVYGKVQGVFFRKYTTLKAQSLQLTGYVQNNTDLERTVEGTVEGPLTAVELFKKWVRTEGSPKSRVDRCEFIVNEDVKGPRWSIFEVKR
jgi:acylphosphatase